MKGFYPFILGWLRFGFIMNFVQEIKQAENEAEKKIEDAKKKASELVLEAEKKRDKSLNDLIESFKEDKAKRISDQKKSLADIYRSIILDGEKEVELIKNKAEASIKSAADFIVDEIISSI